GKGTKSGHRPRAAPRRPAARRPALRAVRHTEGERQVTTRILPAVGEPETDRAMLTLLSQLPDIAPLRAVPDSTVLLDTLSALSHETVNDLPEVVLIHEGIGPLPALELVRAVALRFPAVGVVLVSADPT